MAAPSAREDTSPPKALLLVRGTSPPKAVLSVRANARISGRPAIPPVQGRTVL